MQLVGMVGREPPARQVPLGRAVSSVGQTAVTVMGWVSVRPGWISLRLKRLFAFEVGVEVVGVRG